MNINSYVLVVLLTVNKLIKKGKVFMDIIVIIKLVIIKL